MSHALRAVFLDHASLDLGDLDMRPLRAAFDELQLHAASQPQEASRGCTVRGSRSATRRRSTQCIAACPELELILVSATGTNNIDLAAARERGIVVANCYGYGTPSVACKHTLGAATSALATRLLDYQQAVRSGRWQQSSQFPACWTSPSSNWKQDPRPARP
ncbi:hypothetical protein P4123_24035 [Pseudomonas aeruginosa]|nr:hypothetical protein [Pseudomonas aeruginosa]